MSKTGELLVDRYEILQVLGEGGMGAVYLAKDTRLPRRWAIKVMNDTFSDPEEHNHAVESFRTEANLLSALTHPNLPRITDYFSEKGRHYLVMDFIEGKTLEAVLHENDKLPVTVALDVALQLTEVLGYLHNQPTPIIFRDFKPANVMMTPENRAKLIDFGIARHFRQGQASDTRALGTPGYAAPEQYGQGQSDARTDIYALGATLHHALTGVDPTDTPFMFKPIGELNDEVPEALEKLVMRCLQLKPDDRFQSVDEVKDALEALKTDPDSFELLPDRMRTSRLTAPGKRGFEPEEIILGPVRRGKVPAAKVVLKGKFNHKLKTNQKWLRVMPDRATDKDTELRITASTSSMADGGTYEGKVFVDDAPGVPPLQVKLKLEVAHVTFWSMALAFLFVLGSFVPVLGYLATGLLFSIFFSTPKGERSVMKIFLIVSLLASLMWTAVFGVVAVGVQHVDWDRINPWKKNSGSRNEDQPSTEKYGVHANLLGGF